MSVSQISPETAKKDTSVPNKAASIAMARLRETHRDEYETFLTEAYATLGKTRVRRLTAQERADKDAEAKAAKEAARERANREKALATAQALAAAYPDLVVVKPQDDSVGF